MRIAVVSVSPYRLTSKGVISSTILKHLRNSGHSVISMAYGHSKDYYIPEELNGKERFFYKFDDKKIVLIPIDSPHDPIPLYTNLKNLKPDIVVSVGDYQEFAAMKAVISYLKGNDDTKHIRHVVVPISSNPVSDENKEIFYDVDYVLCISEFFNDIVSEFHSNCGWEWIGSRFSGNCDESEKVRIGINAKIDFMDNIPMVMKAVSSIRQTFPDIELHIHANLNDSGDHDLFALKETFDPLNEFVFLPEKYVSNIDGLSDSELSSYYSTIDVLVSASFTSSSGIGIFEGLAHGCLPVCSECGIHKEIMSFLDLNEFLVRTIQVMGPKETYLYICDDKDLEKKIIDAYQKIKKDKGIRHRLMEFSSKCVVSRFCEKLDAVLENVVRSRSSIQLETIGDADVIN